ncbi:MAG: hypothetical protein K8R69_01845, partial [Deltaproteobacteria bacterium]|nr:hypothetical protein [Deltaproteobacteria bacterium]
SGAQNAEKKTTTLTVEAYSTSRTLPEACGGGDYVFQGNILLKTEVLFNETGGMDVSIQSDHRNYEGLPPGGTPKVSGQEIAEIKYSNSSVESFEWPRIEDFNVQSADGSRKIQVHLRWLFSVSSGGDFSAQLQDVSVECGTT